MPKPPTGKVIYTTKNNYAIALPIPELLEAAGIITREDFAKLPEAGRKLLTEKGRTMFQPLQEQITMKNPGACNAMVLTFLGRVFRNTNDIESPWLTVDEIVPLVMRQKHYILNMFKTRWDEQKANRPAAPSARINLVEDRRVIGADLAGGFDMNPLRENESIGGGGLELEVGGIVESLKAALFCLLGIEFPLGGRHGGHAIALIHHGAKWYVLDPNFGLYRYGSEESFTADLLRLLTEYGTTAYFLLGVSPSVGEPKALSSHLLDRIGSLMTGSPEPSGSGALLDGMPFSSRSGTLLSAMDTHTSAPSSMPVSQSGSLLQRMKLIS